MVAQNKGLPTKESCDWSLTTALLTLDQVPKIVLKLTLQATESCPEHILSYEMKTIPFQVSLLDLLIPDLTLPTISFTGSTSSSLNFSFIFNSLPLALVKKCFTPATGQDTSQGQ